MLLSLILSVVLQVQQASTGPQIMVVRILYKYWLCTNMG